MSTVAVSGSGAPASSGPASSVKSLSAIGARSGVKGGDRQTTRSELRYGCFLPDLTGLARPPPIADLHGLYRVRGGWAQAGRTPVCQETLGDAAVPNTESMSGRS